MEVRFKLTGDDWIAFARETRDHYGVRAYYPWKQAIGYSSIALVVAIATLVIHGFAPRAPFLPSPPIWGVWAGAILIPTIFIAYWIWARTHQTYNVKQWLRKGDTRDLLGEQTVRISPDFIYWKTRSSESNIRWHTVERIAAREGYIYFGLWDDTTIVIPRSAFEDPIRCDDFLHNARTYRRNAPPAEIVCPKCGFDLHATPVDRCPECGWDRDSLGSCTRAIEIEESTRD